MSERLSEISRWLTENDKALRFGIIGAIGCLLGAMVAEPMYWLMPEQKSEVDVLFVLDVTSSMRPEILGVSKGIRRFADELERKNLNTRAGLIAFRDNFEEGEKAEALKFKGETLTSDFAEFRKQVGRLRAEGGGDFPESVLDALAFAAQQDFRADAQRVLILITDDEPHEPDQKIESSQEAASILKQNQISQLHFVINSDKELNYEALHKEFPGETFFLRELRENPSKFDEVLAKLGESVASSLINSSKNIGGSTAMNAALTGVWTALLAAGIGLALIAGQNHYLHRPLLTAEQAIGGTIGGLVAGFIGGSAGQIIFLPVAGIPGISLLGQLLGWGILGALVARGMALYVPNLSPSRAWIGGAVGGAIAAVGFTLASAMLGIFGESLGDALGRLNGAAALGFVIGLMVALIEASSREFWLEIRYGTRETRNVTLGETPVTIGNDSRHSTVYAREAARPIAYRYTVVDGTVVCVDYATEQSTETPVGDQKVMGNVTVTVCDGGKGSPSAAGPTAAPNAPPPPPASFPPKPPATVSTSTAQPAAPRAGSPVVPQGGGEIASPAPPAPPTIQSGARPAVPPASPSKPAASSSGLPAPPSPVALNTPLAATAPRKTAPPTPSAPPPLKPSSSGQQQVINPIAPPPPPPVKD